MLQIYIFSLFPVTLRVHTSIKSNYVHIGSHHLFRSEKEQDEQQPPGLLLYTEGFVYEIHQ